MERWLTYDDVAGYLKVSRATVFNMVRLGTLPAPRLLSPRIKRFDREAIDTAIGGKPELKPSGPTLDDVTWR